MWLKAIFNCLDVRLTVVALLNMMRAINGDLFINFFIARKDSEIDITEYERRRCIKGGKEQ